MSRHFDGKSSLDVAFHLYPEAFHINLCLETGRIAGGD